MTPTQALQLLREGNRRFVAGHCTRNVSQGHLGCVEPLRERAPLAIVLGCSDSRVPLELIFDQEFGALFLVRVAGSIATPSQVGSIEFAVQRFDTPLVVVLGHARCGAVAAAVDDVLAPSAGLSPNLEVIAGHIRPSVQKAMECGSADDRDSLVEAAVKVSVSDTAGKLRNGSEVLKERISDGRLIITGAKYSLRTGAVEFYG